MSSGYMHYLTECLQGVLTVLSYRVVIEGIIY